MRIFIPLIALAAAAPLHAQPAARRLPACITEASASAGTELTRHGCAGTGPDAAVRFSIALPATWEIAFQDTSEMVLTAMDGDNSIWVVGNDRVDGARERITRAQLADSALLALVAGLSTGRDGRPPLVHETEVRMLAGEP